MIISKASYHFFITKNLSFELEQQIKWVPVNF